MGHAFGGIRQFSAEDVRKLVPMELAIDLMQEAFSSFSDGRSVTPQRFSSDFNGLPIDLLLKPAASQEMGRIAVKILTQKKKNTDSTKPTIQGYVMLVDAHSGDILAMMDAAYLTALRTGAASGMATDLLAREDATKAAIFGAGAQGRTQLEAICSVRPIQASWVYDINPDASRIFQNEMEAKLGIPVHIGKALKELKKAQVICTATNATRALFGMEHLSKGVHINAVGSFKAHMQELDPRVIKSGIIYTDSVDAVLAESGDLIKAIGEGVISKGHIRANMGGLINGKAEGRKNDDQVTIFKSVGLAVQDLFVANAVYENAKHPDS